MRNLFDGSRRGRRPNRPGSVPNDSSPYDFGTADDDQVGPVDLMAIRADDELLDALASGGGSFGRHASGGFEPATRDGEFQDGGFHDDGFHDDQRMLAMLEAWRDEVLDEPVPDLVSVEQASEAIVAGQRSAQSRRRLMPVAAAGAAVVLGMSGVVISAGSAEPGDALWGVSKTLNGERAESKEAAQRVSIALASVRQALDEGRVQEAQATLAAIAPELDKVTDEETKRELASKQANLTESAGDAEEGERVSTDESGKRKDGDKRGTGKPDKDGDKNDKDKSDKNRSKSPDPVKGTDPRNPGSPQPDPRRTDGKRTDPKSPDHPSPATSKPEPTPADSKKPETTKPDSTKPDDTKPDDTKPDDTKPQEPKDADTGEGEAEGGSPTTPATPTPNALVPVGPPPVGP